MAYPLMNGLNNAYSQYNTQYSPITQNYQSSNSYNTPVFNYAPQNTQLTYQPSYTNNTYNQNNYNFIGVNPFQQQKPQNIFAGPTMFNFGTINNCRCNHQQQQIQQQPMFGAMQQPIIVNNVIIGNNNNLVNYGLGGFQPQQQYQTNPYMQTQQPNVYSPIFNTTINNGMMFNHA